MPSVKILNNFVPFNDILYKNCFYHAFLPVVTHFNKDIRAFISNNIFVYDYHKKNNISNLGLKNVSNIEEEDILNDLDIGLNIKSISKSVIDDLIDSIDRNNPVIILIDCYYESIRPDAYEKNHYPHALLIYGYDKTQNLFHIIEHQYRESCLYKNRTICFEDIINCYNGYLNNLKKRDEFPTYFEYFSPKSSCPKSFSAVDALQYQKIYINNYKNNTIKSYEGLDQLNLFRQDAEKIFINKSILDKHLDTLFNSLNDIINLKNLERYSKLKLLNVDFDFVNIDEYIISNWNFIRGIIAKYKLTNKYNLKSMEKSLEKLVDICSLEKNSYENLISFLSDWS